MPIITEIADLERASKKHVPKMFFDYANSGSWREVTYRANCEAFDAIFLKQRVGVNVETIQLKTTLFGQEYNMPMGLAPIGSLGMQWADGEILAAKAAKKLGLPFILSTMSICSIEAVARATNHPFWVQLYMIKDRNYTKNFMKRAKAAGCSALVITLDLPVLGQRHKDVINGLSVPPKLTLNHLWQMARCPRWVMAMARTKNRNFGNLLGHVDNLTNLGDLAHWAQHQFEKNVTWDKVRWLKDEWGGKLIVKGIMDPIDAKLAVEAGADGIVVSNHGGRQLDGAPASIHALPAIIAAVGKKTEVLFDGGIRSGQDMLKALAYGAKFTLIGRAYIYGLGANRQQGVEHAIEIIQKELTTTMQLCGEPDIKNVGTHNLWQI